jgi:hypothetical protein
MPPAGRSRIHEEDISVVLSWTMDGDVWGEVTSRQPVVTVLPRPALLDADRRPVRRRCEPTNESQDTKTMAQVLEFRPNSMPAVTLQVQRRAAVRRNVSRSSI